MRLLIVSQYFWPENFRINEVVRDLKQSGHIVDVLTGQPNYPQGVFYFGYGGIKTIKENWDGISIFRIPIFARGKKNTLRLALNYISFILSCLFLGPILLRKKDYDVVFVYAPSPIFQVIPASFLGWLKNAPVVLWVQDLWPQSASATGHIKSEIILKLLEKAVTFAYRHTDLLLAQSEAFIPYIQKLNLSGVPIKYLPNAVDDTFLNNKKTANSSPFLHPDSFNVVFAGNIGTAQAVETIVDAAEKLRTQIKIRFVIFGQGSKLEWLKQQISDKQLDNIILAGHHPMQDMPSILGQASALLVTLAKQPIFALTIPSKLQAYLASGKPVIACLDGEGARIVMAAKAGLTPPAEDAEALANAVLDLYNSSEQALAIMGKNAQNYFKMHYKHDLVMRMLVNELRGAIEEYKRKGKLI